MNFAAVQNESLNFIYYLISRLGATEKIFAIRVRMRHAILVGSRSHICNFKKTNQVNTIRMSSKVKGSDFTWIGYFILKKREFLTLKRMKNTCIKISFYFMYGSSIYAYYELHYAYAEKRVVLQNIAIPELEMLETNEDVHIQCI